MLFFGNNVFLNSIIVISNSNKNIYFTWSAEREKSNTSKSNTSIWWNCFFFLITYTQYLQKLKKEYLFIWSLWLILQLVFYFFENWSWVEKNKWVKMFNVYNKKRSNITMFEFGNGYKPGNIFHFFFTTTLFVAINRSNFCR